MIEIRNLTRGSLGFVTGSKDGEPVVASVEAGETMKVAVKADDPIVVARLHAGAISVGDETVARKTRERQAD